MHRPREPGQDRAGLAGAPLHASSERTHVPARSFEDPVLFPLPPKPGTRAERQGAAAGARVSTSQTCAWSRALGAGDGSAGAPAPRTPQASPAPSCTCDRGPVGATGLQRGIFEAPEIFSVTLIGRSQATLTRPRSPVQRRVDRHRRTSAAGLPRREVNHCVAGERSSRSAVTVKGAPGTTGMADRSPCGRGNVRESSVRWCVSQ